MTNEDEKIAKIDYAGNSKVSKAPKKSVEEPEEKKVEAMAGVEVVQRKKSLGRKIAETFTGDDVGSVGQYLIFEVFIPAAKTTISDMVSQGIERMLFGENAPRSRTSSRRPTTSRVNYSGMYRGDEREAPREMSRRGRANHEMSEIIFTDRGSAEEAIERLSALVDQYSVATVADLYALVDVSSSFTDNKWGWDNLREARITRIREGWLLDMPPTKPIQ